jgi:N-acetylmuramoyl-L-alanine amidase
VKVKNSLLDNASFKKSPNIGSTLNPIGIILHYTASPSLGSAVNWICNKESKVSYHVLIGRDGKIVQTCPFNRIAWHAGISEYTIGNKKLTGLNNFTIGIALENMGLLHKKGNVFCDRLTGLVVTDYTVVNKEAWHNYTIIQLETLNNVLKVLCTHYKIQFVASHSEVAQGRKIDTGALLDLNKIRRDLGL